MTFVRILNRALGWFSGQVGSVPSSAPRRAPVGRRSVVGGLAALATALPLAGAGAQTAAPEFTWRMQSVAGASSSEYKILVEGFARHVTELTGGRLKIETFPAGVLIGTPQVTEAVSKGTLELGHTYVVYYAGREPAFKAANEWPAEVNPMQGAMWFYEGGGAEIMRGIAAKHNLYFLGVTPFLPEHIWSRVPIRNIAEMKGLKIRAGGTAADSFTLLGASAVSMSAEDLYLGLQRGVVDAAEFTTLPENVSRGLHEVSKYVMMPSYSGGGTSDWIINSAAWDALPEDVRRQVDLALQLASYEYYRAAFIEEQDLIKRLPEMGIEIVRWSEEDMKAMQNARITIMRDRYAADSAEYAAKFDSQFKFLQSLGYQVP